MELHQFDCNKNNGNKNTTVILSLSGVMIVTYLNQPVVIGTEVVDVERISNRVISSS